MKEDRYCRQSIFDGIGTEGQKKIAASNVTLVGCGALGGNIATMLVRAGIGRLRIIDRDAAELSNLQRQTLFDEEDVANNRDKAKAAVAKLAKINSEVQLEAIVTEVNRDNVESLVKDADLILDGTDNMQVRMLVNDAAHKYNIDWIYGACLKAAGNGMVIRAGGKPCLRCLIGDDLNTEKCVTAGILSSAVAAIAAFEVTEAFKIIVGDDANVEKSLFSFDLWTNRYHRMSLESLAQGCPCCRDGQYDYLNGKLA